MNTTIGIKAYTKIGIESGVNAADPHKLISMLYEGALLAIAKARNSILLSDIPAKGAAISQALAIIDEGLNASLDKSCLLYTSPSPRDRQKSRMPSSA